MKICLIRSAVGLFILATFGSTTVALASTGELYGYGSRASALGNTMMGGATDSYATFYNPAANSTHPGLQVSLGVSFAHPSFLDIKGITISNNATGVFTQDQVGDVDMSSYLDHLGQVVGTSFNLGEKLKYFTLGVTAFMPLLRVAYIDSGDPFLPEYVSYRSRTQRPQIYASISATPLPHLHLGGGLSVATNLSATTKAFITSSRNSVSSQQFASTIKPGASLYFSAYADPKPLQLGVTVRLPNRYKTSIDVNATARLLGDTNGLPLVVNASSSIYYDPLEFDVAGAYQLTESLWLTLEADWFQYKAFEPPTLTVTDLGSGATLRNSIDTTPSLTNIIVPKIGIEYTLALTKLRGGYMYRPSPVKDNLGPGNIVDPARHSFTAGVGLDLKKMKITEKDIFLDLDAQFHYLVHQHITKSPGNEVGATDQTKVGAPGYDIGGTIYGGGFSLGMNF